MEHEALILHSRGKRISLLAEGKGRFDAFLHFSFYSYGACHGSLISFCEYTKQGNIVVLKNPILKELPIAWARYDIYLLHCLLELSYYFIPVGTDAEEIFSFFKILYQQKFFYTGQKTRKIVVCKLLSLLGMCPEAVKFRSVLLLLSHYAIDNLVMRDLQLINEDVLDEWIVWCLDEHPYGRWFRAVPFFLKVKTDE